MEGTLEFRVTYRSSLVSIPLAIYVVWPLLYMPPTHEWHRRLELAVYVKVATLEIDFGRREAYGLCIYLWASIQTGPEDTDSVDMNLKVILAHRLP